MKTTTFSIILFLICVCSLSSKAQLIAGIIPAGGYISNPTVNLSRDSAFTDTSGTVDINCDNVPDLMFKLIHGEPSLDAGNLLYLYNLNPSYQICAHTGSATPEKVTYYYSGDTINCTGASTLSPDTIFDLGSSGCSSCQGPAAVASLYIIFSDGTNTGWIRITHDLDNSTPDPINFSVNELLTYCNPNSIDEVEESIVTVSPNPFQDEIKISSRSGGDIEFTIYDLTARKISTTSVKQIEMISTSALAKGVYIYEVRNSSGTLSKGKIIKD
jgi:hypothetical protein